MGDAERVQIADELARISKAEARIELQAVC